MKAKKNKIFKNKIIKNSKGNIVKYLSTKNKFFKKFGEIYFNKIKHRKKKGWILHKKNSCLFICIIGKVRFHVINKKKEEFFTLTADTGKILKIQSNNWFAFESLNGTSILGNIIEQAHQDNEILKSKIINNYKISK